MRTGNRRRLIQRDCWPLRVAPVETRYPCWTKPPGKGAGGVTAADAISNVNRTEMTNVTCLINTWDETYPHVFTTPLSSTPDDTVCAEKATRTVSSSAADTVCPREGVTLTTRGPKIKTTKLTLNQTNPSTNGTVKEKSPRRAIIIMVVVVGVVLVALFVMYVIRRQRCCSRNGQAAQAAGHLAGAPGTAASRTTQQSSPSGDEPQYSEIPDEYYDQHDTATSTQTAHDYSQIPDEYYNYYNTRPGAQHPYWEIPDEYYNYYNTRPGTQHPYWEIPDEYYNYYNTRPWAQHPYWEIPDEYYNRYSTYPPTRRMPQDDKDYSVRFNSATAEVAIPSLSRLGVKHPSYDTAPRVWRDQQNYQIPARGRNSNIRSHGMSPTGPSHQYMGLISNHRHNGRPLSYPPTHRVPEDDGDYSVGFNSAAAEVVLPSSTRLGGKHPSYDTAPQVWRDPQNYQIPARGRNSNIRSHGMSQTGPSPQYMGMIGNRRHNRRPLSYPLTLQVPQDDGDYSVNFNKVGAAEVTLPSLSRLGGKHPSYDTAPQVWRDPQNYQIPARGMSPTGPSHQYMGLICIHRQNGRPLSYPPSHRVPQDDGVYSVRFSSDAAEVALPSSTRLGGKHPSYDTAPQVWRDSQNYQIPARGRNTNIRLQRSVAGSSSGPRYMGLIGNYSKTMRTVQFGMQTMPLYNSPPPQAIMHERDKRNQAPLKAESSENRNHTNITCQVASEGVVTISQGDVLATRKTGGKGRVHSSRTLGKEVTKLTKDQSSNKASHNRQSI
uniref:Uncharacterized protein n=1 Tax=Branchiostoma floridae TaxID=7739 RepID=C3YR93_BRAFL|eukprot:XP_002601078.1 hypothetical protein BRAFLDRAFT_75513 [Branchiostoma floridae]